MREPFFEKKMEEIENIGEVLYQESGQSGEERKFKFMARLLLLINDGLGLLRKTVLLLIFVELAEMILK